jgi:hypothetical protein
MRRDDVIARLKEAEPALRARGIRRAAVFGSIARGDDRDALKASSARTGPARYPLCFLRHVAVMRGLTRASINLRKKHFEEDGLPGQARQ